MTKRKDKILVSMVIYVIKWDKFCGSLGWYIDTHKFMVSYVKSVIIHTSLDALQSNLAKY